MVPKPTPVVETKKEKAEDNPWSGERPMPKKKNGPLSFGATDEEKSTPPEPEPTQEKKEDEFKFGFSAGNAKSKKKGKKGFEDPNVVETEEEPLVVV